jgi:carbamoyltransferase
MVGSAQVTDMGQLAAPAVVHVDGTTRPQQLEAGEARVVENILTRLAESGLPPVLVNTSFNERGVPIVNTAEDAIATFRRVPLDFLVVGDELVLKAGSTC